MGLLPGRRFFGSSIAIPPRRVVTTVVVSGAGVAEIQYTFNPATAPTTQSTDMGNKVGGVLLILLRMGLFFLTAEALCRKAL